MLGLDVAFRGKPLNAKVRYSNQIIKHVLHEAELLFAEHRKESRETLALIALLVHADNSRAISVYTRFGFEIEVRGTRGELLLMTRPLLSVE